MQPKCKVIAEIALVHDGSLGSAHAYIDAVARAGADAVKFQTHIAEAESTAEEPWRVRFSPQDTTRFDYWRRTSFTEEQWAGLRRHAVERGLEFWSSPFSLEAVRLLTRVGVAGWKIASGEAGNRVMLNCVLATGLPVMLSTGMSPVHEIDAAVEHILSAEVPLTVLQCTSAYPCPPEKIGLNLLDWFRRRYGCEVGLSDHSGTLYPGLAAAALQAAAVEVHTVFSRDCFGPDVPASLTIAQLAQLVEGIHFIERMNANPVNKDELAGEMAPMRRIFTKSVVARLDLPAGTELQRHHLAVKKPGTGIPAERIDDVIGRVLCRPVAADQLLHEEDLLLTGAKVA